MARHEPPREGNFREKQSSSSGALPDGTVFTQLVDPQKDKQPEGKKGAREGSANVRGLWKALFPVNGDRGQPRGRPSPNGLRGAAGPRN